MVPQRAKKELSHAFHISHNKSTQQMSASASAAPLAAAIYDSDDSPTMGEVSDVVDNDTTIADDHTSNNNSRTRR